MTSPRTNPDFDAYAEQAEPFARPIFAHLRGLVWQTCPDVTEAIRWRFPHFDHAGDVLCILGAFGQHCSFTFYKDALMSDPRLRANADLPAAKRFMGRITGLADLPPDAVLTAWIREAMALNEQGIKLPEREAKTPKVVPVPDALAQRLAERPDVRAIFEAKSASFRKEYNLWIAEAKTDATRAKRLDEAMGWIAEGKGRFWKYDKT